MNLSLKRARLLAGGEAFKRFWGSTPSLVTNLCLERRLEAHDGCVNSVAWDTNGGMLLSGSDDTTVCIWRYPEWALTARLQTDHRDNIFCVKFIPGHSDHVATSSHHTSIFDVVTGERLRSCLGHTGPAVKFDIPPLEPYLVLSCGGEGTVRQFDLRESFNISQTVVSSFGQESSLGPFSPKAIFSISIASNSPNYVAIAGESPDIWVLDRRKFRKPSPPCDSPLYSLRPQGLGISRKFRSITAVALSKDGGTVVGSWTSEDAYAFKINSGNFEELILTPFSRETQLPTHVDLEPTPRPYIQTYRGHTNRRTVKDIQFLGPHDEFVASGSDCGTFFVWDRHSGAGVFQGLGADSAVVNCVVSHPRDSNLVTSGIDSDIKVWSCCAGQQTPVPSGRQATSQLWSVDSSDEDEEDEDEEELED